MLGRGLLLLGSLLSRQNAELVITCAVCGKRIDAAERRYVEIDPATRVTQHVHVRCKAPEA